MYQIIFCLLLFNIFGSSISSHDIDFIMDDNKNWDVLIFSQRWPVTGCIQWMESSKTHTCTLPSPKEIWNIHGIWPTRLGGGVGPSFCNKTVKFNVTELEPIRDELEQFWMNIEKGTPKNSLWRHEWLKHGTCSMILPELDSEYKYFNIGLEWLQKYSMSQILPLINVLPDKTYNIADLIFNIENYLTTKISIHCIRDPALKRTYLSEIRICFDKTLKLINCDNIPHYQKINGGHHLNTNCHLNDVIQYPSNLPTLIVVAPPGVPVGSPVDSPPTIKDLDNILIDYEDDVNNIINSNNINNNIKYQDNHKPRSWNLAIVNIYKLIQLVKWFTL